MPTGSPDPEKSASFDGDADRLVYFYQKDGNLRVVDGDKQFAFITKYLRSLLDQCDISGARLSMVLVQTAYVNSKVSNYLSKNHVHQKLCPTGVKNAHPIVEEFDIGANDEPNGHGTVAAKMDRVNEALNNKEDLLAAKKLKAFLMISNMQVGDAIANLLMIEAILYDLDLSL